MKLEDLPDRERICVDANILIYLLPAYHPNVGPSSNDAKPGRWRHLLGAYCAGGHVPTDAP